MENQFLKFPIVDKKIPSKTTTYRYDEGNLTVFINIMTQKKPDNIRCIEGTGETISDHLKDLADFFEKEPEFMEELTSFD